MAQHGHSAACCSVPPVVAKGYEPKGRYETIAGLKTYVTGPPTATKAILYVFDIFGFFSQSLQGADILSTSGQDSHSYQVFMPDFFNDQPADISWYPPGDDKEKNAKLGEFFSNQGSPPKVVAKVPEILKEINEKHSEIKTWGIVGFCWGGKIVSLLTSQDDTPFKVAAECHPAMVDPEDAKGIKIPMAMLASGDEDEGDVKKFEEGLSGEKHVEIFKDQVHGWMAARADLDDERIKSEYERGYKTLLEFFAKHL